jgi:hypothetical protein
MQKKTYKSAMSLPKEFGTEEFCLSDFMCCKQKGIQSTMNLFQEFGTFNTCTNPNIFPYIFNLPTQHFICLFIFVVGEILAS